jgi:hypothetical protein
MRPKEEAPSDRRSGDARDDLFAGWTAPPTVNADKNDPSTDAAAFDPAKVPALDKLQNHLADFRTDDELGLYIETTLRPTTSDPNARAADKSAGMHNYLHYRFQDGSSKIDMGDPSVNGWIESRWTEFRKTKNLSEDDPKHQAALKKGEDMFTPKLGGPVGGKGVPESPPESLPSSSRRTSETRHRDHPRHPARTGGRGLRSVRTRRRRRRRARLRALLRPCAVS